VNWLESIGWVGSWCRNCVVNSDRKSWKLPVSWASGLALAELLTVLAPTALVPDMAGSF
jgi:hypothetical protein